MTAKDLYPIPRMDKHIDSLGSDILFSTLDVYSRYWHVSVKEEHRNETAFVCHARIFWY